MKWLWNTFFANRAPAWTAFSTVVLMVFSGLLWKVSDRANETSIVTQRAFLTNSGILPVKVINNQRLAGVNFFVVVGNSGTTPAKDAIEQSTVSIGQPIPQRGLDFDSLPQSERLVYVLGPKATMQMTPMFVSVSDLEAAEQGKKHIFFWGWTTYHDIFNGTPTRLSEFCVQITSVAWSKPDHSSPLTDVNFGSPPCQTHNCYDEDCEDYSRRVR